MRMKKNLLVLLSVLVLASLALTACSGAAATQAPAAATEAPAVATEAPAAAPVEVTFWHAYGTGSAEETAWTKIVDQAALDLHKSKINVLQVPFNDIFNKYDTDVA